MYRRKCSKYSVRISLSILVLRLIGEWTVIKIFMYAIFQHYLINIIQFVESAQTCKSSGFKITEQVCYSSKKNKLNGHSEMKIEQEFKNST